MRTIRARGARAAISLTPRPSLALALAFCLALPIGAAAQSDTADEPTSGDDQAAVLVPELEGLAWHRSIDLSGPEIEATLDDDEVAEWATLLDGAGATFDALEYTYQSAFDPTDLPALGGLATVRVAGADTDVLRAVVVNDMVGQVVRLGHDAPESRDATVGGKDVTIVVLPDDLGLHDATVYAQGDVAWVVLMPEDLTALVVEQLP
jgi:hypothetical protein